MGLLDFVEDKVKGAADAVTGAATAVVQKVEQTAAAVEQKVEQTAAAVEQKVEQTAAAVEQKAQQAVQAVKKKAAAVVKTVENTASSIEEEAKTAVATVEDDAKKVVSTVEDDAKKVAGAATGAVKAVEDEAAAAKAQVVKIVQSIVGPITRILPPSGAAAANLGGGLFPSAAAPTTTLKSKCVISLFNALLMKKAESGEEKLEVISGPVGKKARIQLLWEVKPMIEGRFDPQAAAALTVHVTKVTKGLLFDSKDEVGGGKAKSSLEIEANETCDFVLTADSDGGRFEFENASSAIIHVEVDENAEEGEAFGELEVKPGVEWEWKLAEKEYGYFTFEGAIKLEVVTSLKFEFKGKKVPEAEAKEKLVHKIHETVEGEGGDSKLPNFLHAIHLERGKEGVHFLHLKAKEEGGTLGVSKEGKSIKIFEFALETGISFPFGEVPVKFQLVEIAFKDGKPEVEPPQLKVGFEPPAIVFGEPWEIGEGISVSGSLKLSGELTVKPDWKQIIKDRAKDVFKDIGTDGLIDLALTVGIVVGGVVEIGAAVYVLSKTGDWDHIGPDILDFSGGFVDGYVHGLAGRREQQAGSRGAGIRSEGYGGGEQAGNNQRLMSLKKANDNLVKQDLKADHPSDVSEAELDAWIDRHVDEVRAEGKKEAVPAAQQAVWASYAKDHEDGTFFDSARARMRAFTQIFNTGTDVSTKDNGLPKYGEPQLEAFWAKYTNEHTPESFKKFR